MMMDHLIDRITESNCPICLELDTTLDDIPDNIIEYEIGLRWRTTQAVRNAIVKFNHETIDAVSDIIPAINIPLAPYQKFGPDGIEAYMNTIDYAKSKGLIVIGDIKYGDTSDLSKHYFDSYMSYVNIGGVDQTIYDTDFVTLNPYMGYDSISMFIEDCVKFNKGIFVLVKTSNTGSRDFQDINIVDINNPSEYKPLYYEVCQSVNVWGSTYMDRSSYEFNPVGAIVGTVHPIQMKKLRDDFPHLFFLIPDCSPTIESVTNVLPAFNSIHPGAIVNSKGLIKAHKNEIYSGMKWYNAIRSATIELRNMIMDGLSEK